MASWKLCVVTEVGVTADDEGPAGWPCPFASAARGATPGTEYNTIKSHQIFKVLLVARKVKKSIYLSYFHITPVNVLQTPFCKIFAIIWFCLKN